MGYGIGLTWGIGFTLLSASAGVLGTTQLSDDFFLQGDLATARQRIGLAFADAEDCRKKIAKAVCLVDGAHAFTRANDNCLPGGQDYVVLFERVYDQFPPVLQKMFCSLDRIYVEKELESTAYASVGTNSIGIRKTLLDEKLTLAHWATWKEQLSFGGKLFSYEVKNDLPTFLSDSTKGAEDFLYNVMAHEFGHLFDFANDLNDTQAGKLKAGTYGALSWLTLAKPLPQYDFPDRTKICFYDCDGNTLPKTAVAALYQDLMTKTNFLNTYTSRNSREDFADTFGFYVMFTERESSWKFDTRQGEVYTVKNELFSERMKTKVDYLRAFLAKTDINYP